MIYDDWDYLVSDISLNIPDIKKYVDNNYAIMTNVGRFRKALEYRTYSFSEHALYSLYVLYRSILFDCIK